MSSFAAKSQYRSKSWTTENGLPQNSVTSILQAKDGYIWFGTFGGLVRFDGISFKIFNTINAPAIKSNRITGLFEDKKGTLWIGTQYGNLISYKDEIFTSVLEPPIIPRAGIFTICVDNSGAIWIPVGSDLNKYTPDASGKFVAEKILLPKEENSTIGAVVQDEANNIWISTSNALYQYQNGVIQSFLYPDIFPISKDENGIILPTFVSIFIDSKKQIWLVSPNTLARFENGKILPIFQKQKANIGFVENVDGSFFLKSEDKIYRFADDKVQELVIDRLNTFARFRQMMSDRDGVLWFGTYGGGLNHFKDGKFFPITTREGMNEDIISRIIVDEKDNFGMLGNRGVSVISRVALNDLADGRIKTIACASYGVSDGMLNSEGNGGNLPAGWQASDGKFWFPSIQGVIVIDPKFSDLPPPPVYIEEVFLDGKQLESSPQIEVVAGRENLEIHYTGLNFTKPEQVKFKYKLEGFDKDWIEVGTRREAYYSQLPAGNYRFLVAASTTNGIWNEHPASKNVVVLSNPLWKQWWFILAISLLIIIAIVLFYRLRLFQLEKKRQQQQIFSRQLIESQERERKRIAAELHDGLGQHLIIISNWAELGLNVSEKEAPVREQLDEISSTALTALNEVREIIYDLRPFPHWIQRAIINFSSNSQPFSFTKKRSTIKLGCC